MAKNVDVQFHLPRQVADEVEAIAKMAGVAVSSVIKVMLATELRRHQARTTTQAQTGGEGA